MSGAIVVDPNQAFVIPDSYQQCRVVARDEAHALERISDAVSKLWHLAHVEAKGEGFILTLCRPEQPYEDWPRREDVVHTHGKLGEAARSLWSSALFAYSRKFRIEALGEVYVMCNECGARLWSEDARAGEKHDRDRACPYKNRSNGKCEPNPNSLY